MIYKPENFGSIGLGDDTLAFNDMFSSIRQAGRGTIELDGNYVVGSLNATNIPIVEIQSLAGTKIDGNLMLQPSPIFDLTETRVRIIGDLSIIGGNNAQAALLIAKSDLCVVDGLRTDGDFSSGTICIIAASSVIFRGGQIMNRHAQAPAINVSTNPDWGIVSIFHEWPIPTPNVSDVYFYGSEIHGIGGQPWTTYMRTADHVVFDGGIHDNSGVGHMLFQGNCSRITSVGQKFYSELGHASDSVFHCDTQPWSCSNLKVINPTYDTIPLLTKGSGSFPSFQCI